MTTEALEVALEPGTRGGIAQMNAPAAPEAFAEPRPPATAVKNGHVGVLLVNLGTPEATDYRAMRRYLDEFLSDRRVIETPRWLWWPMLDLAILTRRPGVKGRDYDWILERGARRGPLKRSPGRNRKSPPACSVRAWQAPDRGRLGDALRRHR